MHAWIFGDRRRGSSSQHWILSAVAGCNWLQLGPTGSVTVSLTRTLTDLHRSGEFSSCVTSCRFNANFHCRAVTSCQIATSSRSAACHYLAGIDGTVAEGCGDRVPCTVCHIIPRMYCNGHGPVTTVPPAGVYSVSCRFEILKRQFNGAYPRQFQRGTTGPRTRRFARRVRSPV